MTEREQEAWRMVATLTEDLNEATKMIGQLLILRWTTFTMVFLSGALCGVVLYVGTR